MRAAQSSAASTAWDQSTRTIFRPQTLPAFGWAADLNAAYVIIEAGVGFATGSLSLLADAVRNLTDVGGLLIAWGAAVLALRKPTARHTYAYEPERRPL